MASWLIVCALSVTLAMFAAWGAVLILEYRRARKRRQ